MAHQELVPGALLGPLCIDCLADLDVLEELLDASHVSSQVETCAGCRRDARVTYRFQRTHRLPA